MKSSSTLTLIFLSLTAALGCSPADDSRSSAGNGSGGSGNAGGSTGTGGAGGGDCGDECARPKPTDKGASWCDADAWGGNVPDASTKVAIPAGVELVVDCDAQAKSIVIEPGGILRGSRVKSATLTLHGNLVVRGLLDYGTPDDRVPEGVQAEIVFSGMDDEKYVGTEGDGVDKLPLQISDSDVGLWVVDQGKLSAAGALKRAWSYLTSTVDPGGSSFSVDGATGWAEGDKLVLTPTASSSVKDHYTQFDELTLASAAGTEITTSEATEFRHDGCEGASCMRRGEAINLSRNVVIRSADDTAHAHMLVADQGALELDSVELRWLGPAKACPGTLPERRAPIYFFQQEWSADVSFVRRVSIWGGQQGFYAQERSHGVEVEDLAGYDTLGAGISFPFRCLEESCDRTEFAAHGTVFKHVIAAKVGIPPREQGCLKIEHSHFSIAPMGGPGSGCVDCVAVGSAHDGSGQNASGIHLTAKGGRPGDFQYADSTSHNNKGHGMYIWQNICEAEPEFKNIRVWSNAKMGVFAGAYGCRYTFEDFVALDNGEESYAQHSVPTDGRSRIKNGTVDSLVILKYVLPQEQIHIFENVHFAGGDSVGISQKHEPCTNGDQNDPNDPSCTRAEIRFLNPTFDAKVTKPLDFGWSPNKHSSWEIVGFSHPGFPSYPKNFVLYRNDNHVAGGCYNAESDAWSVPCIQ